MNSVGQMYSWSWSYIELEEACVHLEKIECLSENSSWSSALMGSIETQMVRQVMYSTGHFPCPSSI